MVNNSVTPDVPYRSHPIEIGLLADEKQRARRWLCAFFLLHVLAISAFALWCAEWSGSAQRSVQATWCCGDLVIAETLVLVLPGLLLGLLLSRISPRLAQLLGGFAMALTLPWFYIDFLIHRVFALRLTESKTWELIVPVLVRAGDFTLESRYRTVLMPLGSFVTLELVFCLIASWSSARSRAGMLARSGPALGLASAGILISAVAYILCAPYLTFPFLPSTDPHPIHLTGLFDRAGRRLRPDTPLDQRCMSQLVSIAAEWNEVERRYRNLAPLNSAPDRPDVLLVVIESLRGDALNARSAPNLAALADESVFCRAHYSTGNATPLGYFGLMYGLNTLWYERAIRNETPPALPELMAMLGYHRVFLGSWGLEGWYGMDQFLGSRYFDRVEMLPLGKKYVDGDRAAIERARSILEREGEFESLRDKPVFLVLQINTTHYEYHSQQEDQVFVPTTAKDPPWTVSEREYVANRYWNSVHCVDRLLAPLLDRRRVLIVAGDHGESFGEDGFFLHCSCLSPIQLRTPLIFYAPNIEPRQINVPTSHQDVLPTLLDALDVATNDPDSLHGRSLLNTALDATSATLVLGEFRRESWILMNCNGRNGDEDSLFRFALDPFSADFRLEGAADSADWLAHSSAIDEPSFVRSYRQMMRQLCGGADPDLPDDAFASLNDSMRESDTRIRILALQKLALLGPSAKAVIPVVKSYLEDNDPQVRTEAAATLARLKAMP